MIIYLEGPDGSGKSTLSDALTDELITRDMPVIQTKDGKCDIDTHPRSEYRNDAQTLIETFVNYAYMDTIFVLDRGPISDVIYRHFDDYKPVLNEGQVADLLSLLKDKVKVIFCDNDIAEQKMLERGDDNPIAIEKHKDITNCYRNYMKFIKHEVFDYTRITAPIFADKIIDSLKEEYMDNIVKHCSTCKYRTSGQIYPDKCTYMNKEGRINKLSGRTCDYYQPVERNK